jgi:1-acyl-sn-glycerol-3-phosphate acyltransferase
MGKAELARLPVFGYFYKKNTVIVNRAKKRDAYAAFMKAGERLETGLSMCIFPEGGIPKSDVFLKKFKNGPFRLAAEKQIKIVPITMPDNKKMFPQEYFKGRPGIVRLKVHKVIMIDENKSAENLNTLVYNTIFEQLKEYESR